jgi:hypothetical protein
MTGVDHEPESSRAGRGTLALVAAGAFALIGVGISLVGGLVATRRGQSSKSVPDSPLDEAHE